MHAGAVLDERYEIGPELGRGSTATVHRALDLTTGRDVAVKVFTTAPSPADHGRDRREVRILSGLRHPGLVTFLDAGTADGDRYVVTDLIDGRSLAEALGEGTMDAAAVAALGAELADALAYVHEEGVVHRDVKPANILLDRDGRPRLADFGIARLDGATKVTHTGMVVGTAAYMAPEQVRGDDVSAPADVYSLGLVLVEALTGEREYPGSAVEAAIARLHRPPRVPAVAGPALAGVLRRMTAIAPSARPSAAEVATLLRALPEPGAARRGAVRRVLPLAAAAVLVSGLTAGYVLSGPEPEATAPTAAVPPAPSSDAGTGAPTITIVEADSADTAPRLVTSPRSTGGSGRAAGPADPAPADPGPGQQAAVVDAAVATETGSDADSADTDSADTPSAPAPADPDAVDEAGDPGGPQTPAEPAGDAERPDVDDGGPGSDADDAEDDESDDEGGNGKGNGSARSGKGAGGGKG
ncbi:serine/threonine-protein kinase [Pseudonocardia humida]|uniref:non-specific serine/threonine protein kinase n=1 Tax=Pseudonocardia humida TaxID=2800819 RepID=A0ABT0ZSU3_9PSEU|nr:serine/threonine-protein kinase [Pseudonocardia humida]MCO1653791.1 protein kinase [Pseudonocardia humida]